MNAGTKILQPNMPEKIGKIHFAEVEHGNNPTLREVPLSLSPPSVTRKGTAKKKIAARKEGLYRPSQGV